MTNSVRTFAIPKTIIVQWKCHLSNGERQRTEHGCVCTWKCLVWGFIAAWGFFSWGDEGHFLKYFIISWFLKNCWLVLWETLRLFHEAHSTRKWFFPFNSGNFWCFDTVLKCSFNNIMKTAAGNFSLVNLSLERGCCWSWLLPHLCPLLSLNAFTCQKTGR